MSNQRSWTKSFFIGIWTILNFCRKVFFNLIFIALAFVLIAAFLKDDNKIIVPDKTALVLNLVGDIVIEENTVDPFEKFLQEAFGEKEEHPEVLLRDVLFVIENAKHDKRIQALVLNLQAMGGAGMDKLKQIAMALDNFKESGKPIYAVADYYSQNQYYLASKADHVYLNPMGGLLFEGYGRYRTYYKDALEKLKVTTHVFKVGTFKSAVEPYLRNDMSDAAKQANQAWLESLWEQYKVDVAQARGLDKANFDETLDAFIAKLDKADGDFATYALENGWVDALRTREEVRQELIELVGKDSTSNSFSQIGFDNYLSVIQPNFDITPSDADNKVAVVVAKGTILDGDQKAGTIGGDSTARLLRKARLDKSVKAVVMHVDSPGGSAFASEIIRQEVEQLQKAGKPVVALMSTYAASGGYWISASADEIWAAPSTVTGSIGIFGMFMTFENTLDYLGIHADGIGTTEFAGISPARELDPKVGQIIQMSINRGYNRFLNLVSENRDMTVEQVDNIAQGRVWIGETAKELGLVDELGYIDDAVGAAARLANLEEYDIKYIQRDLSASEKFWREFFGQASALVGEAPEIKTKSHFKSFVNSLIAEFDTMAEFNDPQGVYARCLACEL